MLCVCAADQLQYLLGSWASLRVSACEQKLQHTGAHHRHRWDLAVPGVRGGGHRRNGSSPCERGLCSWCSPMEVSFGRVGFVFMTIWNSLQLRVENVGAGGKRRVYPQEGLWAVFRLHCPLLNFSPAVCAQPERTHLWPRLSRILSMLGSKVLLLPVWTYHRMCFHSMQGWRTKYPKSYHKSAGGNLSEDAFHSSRMGWDVIHRCGLHVAELLSP